MGLNVEEVIDAVERIGCKVKNAGKEYWILMPSNFPWYGDDGPEVENSRIVASIDMIKSGDYVVSSAWPFVKLQSWDGEPKGIEMRSTDITGSMLDALRKFNVEELVDWLQKKIGEASKMTKEYRRLALNYQSKEYEV